MNAAATIDHPADVSAMPHALGGAVRVYAGALAPSGGRELEALAREGVAVVLYASPAYDVQVPAMSVARLSINLSTAPVVGAFDGERRQGYAARRHSLFLAPAGASAAWRKAVPSRHINLYFDPRAFGGLGQRPLLNGSLSGGQLLFDALADELVRGDAFAEEAVDSLARLILLRLARQGPRRRAGANPLTPQRLAHVAEHVRAHLDQPLRVADLARVAGLPVNRFASAFVEATGQSPHQYVLGQRLAQARALLLEARMPLAEVAAVSGFSSQQHMTEVMRRRLGQTPARLRRLGDGR